MRSSTKRGIVAAPTALALALGGILLAAGPASAAGPIVVTSPADGSTYDNTQGFFDYVVPITVTNLPAGDTLGLTYDVGTGTPANAIFGGSRDNGDGTATADANFNDLPAGETTVTASVFAFAADGTLDPTVPASPYSFELAVAPNAAFPFTVSSPGTGDVVDTPTPVFTGMAAPGSTVTVVYSNKNLGNSIAGSGQANGDGTYAIDTTFGDLAPGSLGTGASVTQTDPDSPDGRISVNFTFAQAPVPAIDPTITLTPESTTVDEATTTGIAVAAEGFSPGEEVRTVVTDSDGATVELAGRALNYFADDDQGAYTDTLVFGADTIADVYTVTLTGVRSGLVLTADVEVADEVVLLTPTPVITSPTEGQVIPGGTVTVSGTGPAGSGIVLTVADPSFLDGTATAAPAEGEFYLTDLAAPIVVDGDGNWSVTITLVPGDYVAQAVAGELAADGSIDLDGAVSEPSNLVAFSLIAAPAVITPAAPTAPTAVTPVRLAYTGSEAGQGVLAAALLLLVGGGLVVAARRRRTLALESTSAE